VQPSSPSKDLAAVTSRELGRQLAGFFLWVTNSSNHDFLPRITDLELTLTQMKALFQLTVVDELAVKEVADGLGLSDAATSRAVDGLVKRDLVERAEDPADRRVKRVRLTARGRKTIDELAAVRIATFERLVEELSDALEPILARQDLGRFNPRSRR
jgi:DNA-binding MarR family transcriptional regulator